MPHWKLHTPGVRLLESSASVLSHWESFYVIVGSSAGALTGLMFVVLTLVADSSFPRTPDTINAFGTPNVIHFVAVLLVSAILSAPWHTVRAPAYVIGLTAFAGVIYLFIVQRRMRRQGTYTPVREDWIWHLFLPFGAYAALLVAAAGMLGEREWGLFATGGVSLVLMSIGIRNAWDTIAYIAEQKKQP
jgi:hypothetical protein